MNTVIASKANPKYKQLCRWMGDSRQRRKDGIFVVEGYRFVAETIAHDPGCIVAVVQDAGRGLLPLGSDVPTWSLENGLYRGVSQLGPSDGVLAVCRRPMMTPPPEAANRLVVLDQIQNPENLGAIVRSAAAFGWDGVVVTPGTCDPFHPGALRAMAGNWFQTPIYEATQSWVAGWDGGWMMLDVGAKRELADMPRYQKIAVVIGSEGNGISCGWFQPISNVETMRIPMVSGVESLNAAVAAGVVLYYFSNKEFN